MGWGMMRFQDNDVLKFQFINNTCCDNIKSNFKP